MNCRSAEVNLLAAAPTDLKMPSSAAGRFLAQLLGLAACRGLRAMENAVLKRTWVYAGQTRETAPSKWEQVHLTRSRTRYLSLLRYPTLLPIRAVPSVIPVPATLGTSAFTATGVPALSSATRQS